MERYLKSIPSQNPMKNLMFIIFLKVLCSIISSSIWIISLNENENLGFMQWNSSFLKKNPHSSYNFEYLLFATPCTRSFIEILFNLHSINAFFFFFFKYLSAA